MLFGEGKKLAFKLPFLHLLTVLNTWWDFFAPYFINNPKKIVILHMMGCTSHLLKT